MSNYLHIIAIGLIVVGWETGVLAEEDVTIIAPPMASTPTASDTALAPDGTPVIHQSFHRKNENNPGTALTGSSVLGTNQAVPLGKSALGNSSLGSKPLPVVTTAANHSSSVGPAVETGLPIAKRSLMGSTTVNDAAPIPTSATLPAVSYSDPTILQHKSSSSLPAIFPGTSSTTVASYSPPITATGLSGEGSLMTSSSVHRKEPKNSYPWKTNIITTMFYIGEGDTPISRTTNEASAWDEDWRTNNGGTDSPNDRVGYTPGSHAARVNPFYVALPFNDLAFPDKSRRWLPKGWYRAPKDGKQVSACQHRWVEIKNAQGRSCFAQWEDVGPLSYDNAEYVFGSERPEGLGGNHAGLDVSPAVAQCLNLDSDKKGITRWRFVDAVDVPPGDWLKFDEEAVIYQALHDMKKAGRSSILPSVQKAAAPIEDAQSIDSNVKKVGAAKG